MYSILPALIPDIEKTYDVYFSAFKNDVMGRIIVDVLFPNGTDDPEFRKTHAAGTLAWWQTCGYQYTYKCVDMETGEIVGMALGDVMIKGRTEEQRQYHSVPWLEGEQKERADAILKPLHDAREKLFSDRPHVYVHVIAVDPKHQGRGAGAAWCRWGIEFANSVGLPLYFEASPSTYKLYEKMGYETIDEKVEHSAELLGLPTAIQVPLMVKMPAAARGLTFREWRAAGFPSFAAVREALGAASAQQKKSQEVKTEVVEVAEIAI